MDGTVAIFSLMFGGTALYRCNVGFIENGPISRECQSSGWSGNETFCDRKSCTSHIPGLDLTICGLS